MNLWLMLCLAVIGMMMLHSCSYLANQMEKEHSIPEDPTYFVWVSLALIGAFISAFSLWKIEREIEKCHRV